MKINLDHGGTLTVDADAEVLPRLKDVHSRLHRDTLDYLLVQLTIAVQDWQNNMMLHIDQSLEKEQKQ